MVIVMMAMMDNDDTDGGNDGDDRTVPHDAAHYVASRGASGDQWGGRAVPAGQQGRQRGDFEGSSKVRAVAAT